VSAFVINPYSVLFTPNRLANLALWLDAGDSGTVILNGSDVSEWRDKSGNDRHASQATPSNQPAYTSAGQNGLNTITLDGSNDGLSLAADLSLGSAHSIFVVAKNNATITAATGGQLLLGGGSSYVYPSTTTSDFLLGAGSVSGTLTNERLWSLVVAQQPGSAQVYGYGKTNADVAGAFFLSSAYTTTANAFTGRLNGAADFTTSTSGGSYSSSNTRYPTFVRHIGFRGVNNANFWSGDINEIIITSSYLSLSDTERIEGYLAHKWGVAANLPAGHPYKTSAP
jgi:hypothetical protein